MKNDSYMDPYCDILYVMVTCRNSCNEVYLSNPIEESCSKIVFHLMLALVQAQAILMS